MKRAERYDISRFIGEKYNSLTILKDMGKRNNESRVWVRCECGKESDKSLYEVKSGGIKSCGCIKKKMCKPPVLFKHGFSRSVLYKIWSSMKARCTNEKNPYYYNYGGRGVKVCDEWINDAKAFCEWALDNGYAKGLELDKDKLGNGMVYSPQTCCFISKKENNRYKRDTKMIIYKGETRSLLEWCEMLGIEPAVTNSRIYSGMSIEEAFSIPSGKRFRSKRILRAEVVRLGVGKSIRKWCNELNAPYQKIRRRMDRYGVDFEEALKYYS